MIFCAPNRTLNVPLGARQAIFEDFLHVGNLRLEVKWLKGILKDRMIKGFESQEKSAFSSYVIQDNKSRDGGMEQSVASRGVGSLTEKWHYHFFSDSISCDYFAL